MRHSASMNQFAIEIHWWFNLARVNFFNNIGDKTQ